MPHTNNQYAADRKASRSRNKPAFLVKKPKPSQPALTLDPATVPKDRAERTALIREFHALEKQIRSPATTEEDKQKARKRQEELGGIEKYQEASVHGGDKIRGGESSKWLVKQIQASKVGVDPKDKGKEKEKVEPTVLEDGTKVWPKVERRKLKLLDIGAIAGTAYADWPWIEATSIDLNPQAPHVIKSNFFDFAVPEDNDDKFDVVSLSLVMNFEGSLVNRGHFLLRAHDYLRRAPSSGYLYIVLPLPCLTNSRYMNHARFRSILASTGWTEVKQHDSAKLTYWFVKESEPAGSKGDGKAWKREEVVKGVERNNFCIVVKPDHDVERDVEGEREPEVVGTGTDETVRGAPASTSTVAASEGAHEGGGTKGKARGKKRKAGGDSTVPESKPTQASKKRKAVEEVVESQGEKNDGGEGAEAAGGDGQQQKKKKAKKSKAVKGKKTVFGDDGETQGQQ
ncbi:hypothetical protein JCM10212_006488 [Sporobolomyces blumeae]